MSSGIDPWVKTLLLKAAEDEASIQIDELPDGPFGFHAQQAVEKLIKALLSQLGIGYDYTHDVTKLAQQLNGVGENMPSVPATLSELNQFAVIYRYDSIPEVAIPDRPAVIETVRLIREHIVAASLPSPQLRSHLRYNRTKRLPARNRNSPVRRRVRRSC